MLGDSIWAGNTQVWIQGYGTVRVQAESQHGQTIIQLHNVALCPDILCNLVSFRLLRQQGIWWDNKCELTMLRRRDDSIVANLFKICDQWVIERQSNYTTFYMHTSSKTKRATQSGTAILWHKRLGHPGPAAIEHLVHQSEGVKIKGTTTVECDACGRAKSKQQIRRTPRVNEDGPGERIALDFHSYEEGSSTKEKS
jgi:hypothetical protein